MTLEEDIVLLTKKWYQYVNLDHHKDRDCHWYITKTYSYGEEAYYEASHSGYVLDHWTSPRCGTEEMALTLLRDKLKREIDNALDWLNIGLPLDKEVSEYLGKTEEDINELVRYLKS